MASTFETKGRPSRQDALDYHSGGRTGKIEIVPTKPVATSRDLSLAYSPGVAEPCLEIARDPDLSYKYTVRGNLVAVISNGTAVLGLGDIGAYASKPVMEGKGVLFKKFADIRSEEHTSELQSLAYLVCRLLLEKKKTIEDVHTVVRPSMVNSY